MRHSTGGSLTFSNDRCQISSDDIELEGFAVVFTVCVGHKGPKCQSELEPEKREILSVLDSASQRRPNHKICADLPESSSYNHTGSTLK